MISSLFQFVHMKRRRRSGGRRRGGTPVTLTMASFMTQVSLFFFSSVLGSPVVVMISMMTLLQQHQQQSWLLVLLVILGNVDLFSSPSSSLFLVEATTPTTADGSGTSETLDAAITAATTTTKTTTTVSQPPRLQDLIRRFLTTYGYCLSHYPLATECLTAACMAGLGDYIAQRLESRGSGNDGNSRSSSDGGTGIIKTGSNVGTGNTTEGSPGRASTTKMTMGTTSSNAATTATGTMTTDTTTPSTSVRGFVKKKKNTKSSSSSSSSIDRKRSLTFVGKGLVEGVIWSFWYHQSDRIIARFMSTLVDSQWIPTGDGSPLFILIRTFLALLTDFGIACPIIFSLWDIPLPALARGIPLRMIPRQIRIKLPEMMWASIKLWMLADIVIYNSPVRYRVLIMSTADVFWQAVVSTIATREDGIEQDGPSSSSMEQQQSMIKPKFDRDATLEEGIALLPVGGHLEMDKEEDEESSPSTGTGAATTTTTTSSSYLSSVSSLMTTGGGFFSKHAKKTRKM